MGKKWWPLVLGPLNLSLFQLSLTVLCVASNLWCICKPTNLVFLKATFPGVNGRWINLGFKHTWLRNLTGKLRGWRNQYFYKPLSESYVTWGSLDPAKLHKVLFLCLVFRLEHCYPNRWRNPSTKLVKNSSKSMAPRFTHPPASTSWQFRRMPSCLPNPWPTDPSKVWSHKMSDRLPNIPIYSILHHEGQGTEGTSISFCSGELRHLQTWFKCSVTASIPSLPHCEKLLKLFWISVFNSFCSSTGKVWIWPQ